MLQRKNVSQLDEMHGRNIIGHTGLKDQHITKNMFKKST